MSNAHTGRALTVFIAALFSGFVLVGVHKDAGAVVMALAPVVAFAALIGRIPGADE